MRVLGLISGTSVDAIDVAVCDVDEVAGAVKMTVVDHREVDWDPALRDRILACLPPATTTVGELCALDQAVGQAFGAAAAATLAEVGAVDLICSHGQTLFHWVEDGVALGTLQVGEAAWIEQATATPVINNLRAADIAAGGQGAPLASILDVLLFGDRASAVVNLGGIANVTIVGPSDAGSVALAAGDTGTANCLMDAVMRRETGRSHDVDGHLALSGVADQALVDRLGSHPWLQLPLPKSTGREVFSLAWLDEQLAAHEAVGAAPLELPDLMATLAEFSASTLLAQVRPFEVERVVVSGGGQHNQALMDRIRAEHPVVQTTDELGLPGSAKEAVLIALVGWLSATGRPGIAVDSTGRALTGAQVPRILGQQTMGQPTS